MAIVSKVGGSSVATAEKLRQVHRFVTSNPERKYIVVSAAGKRDALDTKVTDLLRECIRLRKKRLDFGPVLDQVCDRHLEIVHDLGLDLDLSQDLEAIRQAATHYAPDDYIESRGEYLMGRIVSSLLGLPLVDPTDLVFFDGDVFKDALTYKKAGDFLRDVPAAVIPGYYGGTVGDPSRIKVFARGGSDISGAIIARSIGARLYENCTDVYGVYGADPRIVPHATTIAEMSHQEARELAYMGASVIHPDAIFPVLEAEIRTRILNTADPDGPATNIVSDMHHRKGKAIGVAGRDGYSIISIMRGMMHREVGFAWHVLGVLKDLGISFDHQPGGFDSMSIVVEDCQLQGDKILAIEDGIKKIYPTANVSYQNGLSMIAVVGEGMVEARGSAANVLNSLASEEINVRIIDQGASEMVIVVGVESKDLEAGIRTLYYECVEKK